MRLNELLNALDGNAGAEIPPGLAGVDVVGLTADSRQVQPGFLFFAIAGTKLDGAQFVGQAIENGAAGILCTAEMRARVSCELGDVPLIVDENPRRALSLMASTFYSARPDTIVAVTGTNGKSSVASFLRQIWEHAGRKAASMGTLGIEASGAKPYKAELGHTTPDPVAIHEHLSGLHRAGVTHLALESSSHGLDQFRLDGVAPDVAAMTTLTRDHFDYHEDFADYVSAKLRLFNTVMERGGRAVLNADADYFDQFESVCWGHQHDVITVGRSGQDIKVVSIHALSDGQQARIEIAGKPIEFKLPLVGTFQVTNALVAAGCAIAAGDSVEIVTEALGHLQGVAGRLELVGKKEKDVPIYVDYAHTPDALTAVLTSVRAHVDGRLLLVFGCGGDRDRGKRPAMGAIAQANADMVYVTDDNPRTEDSASIRAEILAQAPGAIEIADRREAIGAAIDEAVSGDVVLIAGKGHETGQIIGDEVMEFDDAKVARSSIGMPGAAL